MRRIRIIVHGERAADPFLEAVVEALRQRGATTVVRPTWEGGDAEVLALEGFDSGADLIVAAGGDGTVNAVINGLIQADATIPVGILPLGTGNDFAGSSNLPSDDIEALAELLAFADPTPIDVIHLDETYFLNAATGGFAAEAAGSVSPGVKKVFGGIAYLLSGIAHLGSLEPQDLFIEGPNFEWSGGHVGFAVTNARSAGGGHRICPRALVDDGLLDIVVLPGHESLLDAARVASDLKFEPDEAHVLRWQAPWVEIQAPAGVALNVDGEPSRRRRMRFEVLRGAVEFILPTPCPLLSGSEPHSS